MASIIINKFVFLVAVWLLAAVGLASDSINGLSNVCDGQTARDIAALKEARALLHPGLFPREELVTVTVTDTVCAPSATGVPAPHTSAVSTFSGVPTLTDVTVTLTGPSTTTVGSPTSWQTSVLTSEHTSEHSALTSITATPPTGTHPTSSEHTTVVISTHTGSHGTATSSSLTSMITSGEHNTHHISSQTTTGSGGAASTPGSSHSSTAPPVSNAAFVQGGIHISLLALAATFVVFVAI